MTPGQYIALARDIAIVAGIAVILWLVYRGGEDRVKAADLRGLQTEIQQQAKTLNTWRQESTDANEKLSKDVSAINAAAAIPVQHVWVRDTSCPQPSVLPATTGKASPKPAATGPVQSGLGEAARIDRRDAILADFKRRWETVLAECRALDVQWPQP